MKPLTLDFNLRSRSHSSRDPAPSWQYRACLGFSLFPLSTPPSCSHALKINFKKFSKYNKQKQRNLNVTIYFEWQWNLTNTETSLGQVVGFLWIPKACQIEQQQKTWPNLWRHLNNRPRPPGGKTMEWVSLHIQVGMCTHTSVSFHSFALIPCSQTQKLC